ncbi:hypothetical protein BC835DRAFT_1291987 [Cytidiella melzeri]|nr:hypothetical protein BC835DRAFT_1291987 [Cytidiella melzeri]
MSPPGAPSSRSRFAPYRQALQAISARTGSPLPSLILSFGIMHEITAIVPLVAIFFASRNLGVGERIVSTASAAVSDGEDNALKQRARRWMSEGAVKAETIGRKYGIFGFERRTPGTELYPIPNAQSVVERQSPLVVGDVANVIVAYGLTKVLLPVRIGVSLYCTPWFSRSLIEPLRVNVTRVFRRK